MHERPAPATPDQPAPDRTVVIVGGLVLGVLGLLAAGVLALVFIARGGGLPGAGAANPANPAAYAYPQVGDAPPLELTDQDGRPFVLTSLAGHPVLVFFGYTHCPDVCPATIGTLNEALAGAGAGPRAVFVSIDPDRDNAAAMKSYVRYLPPVYRGLSGSPEEIRRTADAWGVKYAKVDEGSPDGYAMAHTADVLLVDAQGRLRAHFPFGTTAAPITASLKALLRETPAPGDTPPTPLGPGPSAPAPTATPSDPATPVPTASPPASSAPSTGDLRGLLVSSGVWAGPQTPVIVTLSRPDGTPLDGSVSVVARVVGADEAVAGPDVPAVAILPEGAKRASFVATVTIPAAGWWRLDLLAADGTRGSIPIQALDPGTSAPIGGQAPAIDTPTLADVAGHVIAITTQPAPDLRFYAESTADARAAGKPYVIVIDSARFKVSSACGRAITMSRFLLDRWEPDVAFIHIEPFVYQVITEEPVLSGDLANPPLNEWAAAWGLGDAVWPATDMPWIFVVDGNGIVRAKYTGIVGSADVDLVLSLIQGRGVVGG